MKKLSKLENLINEITDDEAVKRFKKLEKIIDTDQALNSDYNKLKELQKVMVNKREKGSKDLELAVIEYETAKANLLKHVILNEYLELLEEINYDLGLIQKIISEEINIDFE